MTEKRAAGLATRLSAQRGLWATHLVLDADDGGGGAGERQAHGDDGEGGQDVEDAVQLDRHDLIPFSSRRAGLSVALSDVDNA